MGVKMLRLRLPVFCLSPCMGMSTELIGNIESPRIN